MKQNIHNNAMSCINENKHMIIKVLTATQINIKITYTHSLVVRSN